MCVYAVQKPVRCYFPEINNSAVARKDLEAV